MNFRTLALVLLMLSFMPSALGQEDSPQSPTDVGPLPEGWSVLVETTFQCEKIDSIIRVIWLTDGTPATGGLEELSEDLPACGLNGGQALHEVYKQCGDTGIEVSLRFPKEIDPDETVLVYPCWAAEPDTIDPARVDIQEFVTFRCDNGASLEFLASTQGEISPDLRTWDVRVRSMPCMDEVVG